MNDRFPAELETPCPILDRERLGRNIREMQETARLYGVALRPHVKTHKSVRIARMQIVAGAVGITASKTEEALVFIRGGFKSVTVAYPVLHPAKLDRLFQAALEHGARVRMVVDSAAGHEALTQACARRGITTGVFIEIDVGLRRCGLREDDPILLWLARAIDANPRVSFAGLLAHAGHAYAAANAAEVAAIAAEECAILGRLRQAIEREGIPVPEISVGATPTALVSSSYDGITELRPGNYAFLDLTCVRMGIADADRIALSVLATVVGVNQDYYIIDAGSKTLSSDAGAHGLAAAHGYGLAYALEDFDRVHGAGIPASPIPLAVARLSEEHGFLKREGHSLKIGDRVRILPNHACPVANLAQEYVVVEEGRIVDRWPVDARGCVR